MSKPPNHLTESEIDVLADAEHETALALNTGSDKLDNLKRLAKRQVDLEDEIEALEAQLNARRKELNQLSQKDLPLAFGSLGLTNIGIGNVQVRIEHGMNARMPPREQPEARQWVLDWLTLNKHDGVIKVTLEVKFGRGDWKLAQAIAEDIRREFKLPVSLDETVHQGTYQALMKDLIVKKKQAVPEEKLNVFQYVYTVVDR